MAVLQAATTRPSPPTLFRILLVTLLFTLMAFVITLLLAILGTVSWAAFRGIRPDMTIAYRDIALPVAVIAGGFVFVSAVFVELRERRQTKVTSESQPTP